MLCGVRKWVRESVMHREWRSQVVAQEVGGGQSEYCAAMGDTRDSRVWEWHFTGR